MKSFMWDFPCALVAPKRNKINKEKVKTKGKIKI